MMDTFTRMIRKNFPEEEHRFLYFGPMEQNDRPLLDYGNSIEVTGTSFERFQMMRKEMDAADVIIWHGLIFGAKRSLALCLMPQALKKSLWVMRGIDLFNWEKEGHGLKTWLTNQINYTVRKKIPYAATVSLADTEVYRKVFPGNKEPFYMPYPIAESAFELMEQYRGVCPRPNGKVYIQVAHNAYTFNRHLEILDSIKHFQDENVRVIIPLSYGNDWYNQEEGYARTVANCAVNYFGEKAAWLKRLMPPSDYSKLLCNVDISIYGASRQNGLGNILRSLYIGNKVYLSNQNPLFQYFKNCGIDVYETESISDLTFEEFCAPSDPSNAVEWIRRNHYPDACAVYWGAIFESFKNGYSQQEGVHLELDNDDVQKRITAVLAETFSDKSDKRTEKLNYINLWRYIELPKRTRYDEIKDTMILGAGAVGIHICHTLIQRNKEKVLYAIEGLADYHTVFIEDPSLECDVVGTPDNIELSDEVFYINALEPVHERKKAAERLFAANAQMLLYEDAECSLSPGAKIEDGCVFLGRCEIQSNVLIGKCCMMKSAFVDHGSHIGAYCTLERGCWIGENVKVGDFAVIGAGTKIAPGITIKEGTTIPPFSTVTESI